VDPATWLRQLPPFRDLDVAALDAVTEALEVAYVAAGSRVLVRGGAPSEHLHVVRKGTALLSRDGQPVLTVEAGEWFGLPSVLAGEPPEFDVDALDDLLVYRLPAAVVREVADAPAFAAQATQDLATRLRSLPDGRALAADAAGGALLALAPVAGLVTRPLVTCDPDASVEQVAATMRRHRVTSVVLRRAGSREGTRAEAREDDAIVTDRDLRDRVLAAGLGPSTPARVVASSPIVAVDDDTPVADAQLAMLERAIHHLGVRRDGQLVGVVTTGDLLRHQATSPLHVQRELEVLDRDELGRVPERLRTVVGALVDAGLGSLEVARTVSTLTDTLVRRAVELALTELGPAPAPFAWLTLGSDARREQTLLTDQDHALVHGEVDDAGAAWFAGLADDVTAQLAAAGIPPCPAGTTARRWRGTLPWWRQRFARWLGEPDARALLEAGIFLDHRAVVVDGHLDVGELDAVVRAHRHDGVLLARLASAAATARPPLGLFQRLRGDADHTIDLKAGGLAPIVDLARLLAVESGIGARATVDRLRAAADAGTLSRAGADELVEAFAFLQRLRLEAQLAAAAAGREATNRVHLDALGPVRRRHLKEAFVAVARVQQVTVRRLAGEEVAR
jgi:CBS domain-containing protein